eukprot:g3220.t1
MDAKMSLTLLVLDSPTPDFAAVFTKNAFPGAPVQVGRNRLKHSTAIGACVINNKISNVCTPTGVADSEHICKVVAELLSLKDGADAVLPSSTGVIGWSLPVNDMVNAIPSAVDTLQSDSILPAAEAIMTTDSYPKVRGASVGSQGGKIVGVAKGAGMVEPNLATMLVFILTDLAVPRDELRAMLKRVVEPSFNCISIDSDQSTSDTVVLLSSGKIPLSSDDELSSFERELQNVCTKLAEDVVRNGEGVQHVLRVTVDSAPSYEIARGVGKAIVNSPLTKAAVYGNDPNVGRIAGAIGDYLGSKSDFNFDLNSCEIFIGETRVFRNGLFELDGSKEERLSQYMQSAELENKGKFPKHNLCVEIAVHLNIGESKAVVLGADLTHDYVSENADYRS